MKKALVLGLVAMLAVLAVACGPRLKGGQPDAQVVSNGKIAVQQGDYIYYINGSMPATLEQALSTTAQGAIFRMNKDGSDKQQLSTKKAYDFYIYKDAVYYVTPVSGTALGIYKTTINGGASKKVYTFNNGETYCFGPNGIAVEHNKSLVLITPHTHKKTKIADVGDIYQIYATQTHFYYTITNRAGVNRVGLQGGEVEQVAERNGRILAVDGDYLYYIKSNDYLHKVDMVNKTETQLSNTIYQSIQLSVTNNTMVGTDNNKDKSGFYLMKLDGSTRVRITDSIITAYVLSDSGIYYYDGVRKAIYAVDYNGENEKKIADAQAVPGPGDTGADYYMDIVGDTLYFFSTQNNGTIYSVNLTGDPVLTDLQK